MPAYAEARHDINGIDTAVLTAGEGAPIVVLHGGGTAPDSTSCCRSLTARG